MPPNALYPILQKPTPQDGEPLCGQVGGFMCTCNRSATGKPSCWSTPVSITYTACCARSAQCLHAAAPTTCSTEPWRADAYEDFAVWSKDCKGTLVNQSCPITCKYGGSAALPCLPGGVWSKTSIGPGCEGEQFYCAGKLKLAGACDPWNMTVVYDVLSFR